MNAWNTWNKCTIITTENDTVIIMIYEQIGCHQETSLGLSVVLLLECVTKVTLDTLVMLSRSSIRLLTSLLFSTFITTVSKHSKRLDLDLIRILIWWVVGIIADYKATEEEQTQTTSRSHIKVIYITVLCILLFYGIQIKQYSSYSHTMI